MNPYDERRLIDEVIYLHSLWHQGPPSTPLPNPRPLPIPTTIPYNNNNKNIAFASEPYIPQPLDPHFHGSPWHHNRHHQQPPTNPVPTLPLPPTHTRSLPPAGSTAFKKKKKNQRRRGPANNALQPDLPRSPGPEWPCLDSPDPPATGWPASKKPRLEAPEVSSQEKERLAVLQAQSKACQTFKEFLLDDDDEEEEEDDDDDEWEEFEGFFVRIFMEDKGLRSYYQRSFENGEFCCLVCGAVGKKNSGKKFKDCVGLLQHAMSILRTVKKRAHRAFGQAVCKVLGWDIDRLPTIVVKGEPLGCSVKIKPSEAECSTMEGDLRNNAENLDEKMLDIGLENGEGGAIDEGEPKEKVDDCGKERPHKQDDKVVSLKHDDEPVQDHARALYLSISEFSSTDCVYYKNVGNLDERMLHIGSENEGGGAIDEISLESPVSGAEWVCKNPNTDSSSTGSAWPTFHTRSSSQTCSLSAEEQANVAVLQMQYKALEACEEYLVGNAGSDCDDDNDGKGDDDDVIDDSDPEQCEDFKFFVRLFTEDSDLRRYYENNYREGDFYCLVCGGIGKKMWKRFKDCIALLQHSTAVKRTKRKQAHRAYSQVICKVLGWNIDRFPAIVLKSESLGSSLAGSRKL